jgi:hypothetical protein
LDSDSLVLGLPLDLFNFFIPLRLLPESVIRFLLRGLDVAILLRSLGILRPRFEIVL